jgi:DNA-binding SARP family transcriptional activator
MVVPVRMFGPLELQLNGARLGPRDFGGVKPKQLLEALLLDRGRLVPKDRIAEMLWGERLPQRVAATIETYVSVLRRTLGRRLVITDRGGYLTREIEALGSSSCRASITTRGSATPPRCSRSSVSSCAP